MTSASPLFFLVGGPHAGRASVSLEVNSDHVVLDEIWAWRADHGNGVGWTQNTADTGVVVNGDDVSATGLFVEQYQKFQVIWNGENGTDIFFRSEMPYDVPNHAAWMSSPSTLGYAAVKVSPAPITSPDMVWAPTASSTRATPTAAHATEAGGQAHLAERAAAPDAAYSARSCHGQDHRREMSPDRVAAAACRRLILKASTPGGQR